MMMVPGPMCKPNARRAKGPEATDAFSFGAVDANAQTMQNMMTMMAAPWAAMWALQSELAQETMRRAFGG